MYERENAILKNQAGTFTVIQHSAVLVMNCWIVCISSELPETSFEYTFNENIQWMGTICGTLASWLRMQLLSPAQKKVTPKTLMLKEFVNNSAT